MFKLRMIPNGMYNFDDHEDWPHTLGVIRPGVEMEEIRRGLSELQQVPCVFNPLNADQMKELVETICNPQLVELPNMVKNYTGVKQFVLSCLE